MSERRVFDRPHGSDDLGRASSALRRPSEYLGEFMYADRLCPAGKEPGRASQCCRYRMESNGTIPSACVSGVIPRRRLG